MLYRSVAGALALSAVVHASYNAITTPSEDVCAVIRKTVQVTVTVTVDPTADTAPVVKESSKYGPKYDGKSAENAWASASAAGHGYDGHWSAEYDPDYSSVDGKDYGYGGYAGSGEKPSSSVYGNGYGHDHEGHDGSYDGSHDGSYGGGYNGDYDGEGYGNEGHPSSYHGAGYVTSNSAGGSITKSEAVSSAGKPSGGIHSPVVSSQESSPSLHLPIDPVSRSSFSSFGPFKNISTIAHPEASSASSKLSSASGGSSGSSSSKASSSSHLSSGSESSASSRLSSSSKATSSSGSSSGSSSSSSSLSHSSATSSVSSLTSFSSLSSSSTRSSASSSSSIPPLCIHDNEEGCAVAGDCCNSADGASCVEGTCVPFEQCILDNQEGCAVAGDCCGFADGASCVEGTCVPFEQCIPDNQEGCAVAGDCCSFADGASCVEGTCVPFEQCIPDNQEGCTEHSDCCGEEDGATCRAGTCLPCVPVTPRNAVVNPSFDGGAIAPWTVDRQGAVVHVETTGPGAASVDSDGWLLDIAVSSGTASVTLEQSGLAILDGTTVSCKAFATDFQPEGASFVNLRIDGVSCGTLAVSPGGAWTEFGRDDITVSGNEHTVRLLVTSSGSGEGGGSIFIDNIRIIPVGGPGFTTCEPPPEVCIPDGPFETPCATSDDCCRFGEGSVCLESLTCGPEPPSCAPDNSEVISCTESTPCCSADIGTECSLSGVCIPPVCIRDNLFGCGRGIDCCEESSTCNAGTCEPCAEENAVVNGGFATGSLSPWTAVTGGAEIGSGVEPDFFAPDGDGFAVVLRLDADISSFITLTQLDVAIPDGTTVSCSAYAAVIGPSVGDKSASFTIFLDDAVCAVYSVTSGISYTQFTGETTVSGGDTHVIRVGVNGLATVVPGVTLYLDAVEIVPISGPGSTCNPGPPPDPVCIELEEEGCTDDDQCCAGAPCYRGTCTFCTSPNLTNNPGFALVVEPWAVSISEGILISDLDFTRSQDGDGSSYNAYTTTSGESVLLMQGSVAILSGTTVSCSGYAMDDRLETVTSSYSMKIDGIECAQLSTVNSVDWVPFESTDIIVTGGDLHTVTLEILLGNVEPNLGAFVWVDNLQVIAVAGPSYPC